MSQEEDLIGHVLGVTKLGISLPIARKRRRKTKTPKKTHPREIDQDTRSKPEKLILAKNGIHNKKVSPRKKMLQP